MPFEPLLRAAKLRDDPRPGLVAGVGVALAVALAVVVFGALGPTASQVSALTPTLPPTSTATLTVTPTQTSTPTPEPTLIWTIDVSPASPVAGDDIKVTAYASGEGGLPKYTFTSKDDPALLALESAVSVVPGTMLGVPASWDVGTLGVGEAHFTITVNYEREFCTPTNCFFAFTNENSPQVSVEIGAPPPVGGIASLPLLESGAPGSRSYLAVQTALITASAFFGVGALAWLARRTVLRRGAS